MIAAFLYAQLENLEDIQSKRRELWGSYDESFRNQLDRNYGVSLPLIPPFATNNANMYYLVCASPKERDDLIAYLQAEDIMTVFHYLPRHTSKFHQKEWKGAALIQADHYSDCLLRLPFFYELSDQEQGHVIRSVLKFNHTLPLQQC